MSLVYITHHDENIYNIESGNKVEKRKKEKYVSKFNRDKDKHARKQNVIILEDGKKLLTDSRLARNKTMGCAVTPQSPPSNFLRKNQGVRWQRENIHHCPKRIPPIPPVPRYERPKHGESKPKEPKKEEHSASNVGCPHKDYLKDHKHRANFIDINIERAKKALPDERRPPLKYIDTPRGTRHNLLSTGLIPQYICHKNFGKVPCYLRYQNKKLAKYRLTVEKEAEEQRASCAAMSLNAQGIRSMGAEERNEILAGLKTNFAETLKYYISLPLYTDTVAKKMRKGNLERDLRQLEQDIFLIESNPTILISEY